ncbi:FtsX-like permease family protein [Brachybacterium sp. J144]|uniref:FtsX-like permease family protein n=1 Tax=Brachybacterium sp. J144 TaxID=3116487 RepID=UPI002E7A38C1|nr:FtsX-like permease family protein [Brachybacterium sp. J144]MEE1649624.1 FtsX-like permease family protein [Brachybacterium sp. J144]
MARPRVRLTPLRRHLAAVVTVALSCAFVAVMVLAGALMQDTLRAQASQAYAGADLEITRELAEEDWAAEEPLPAPAVEGVESVWPIPMTYLETSSASTGAYLEAVMLPPGEELEEGTTATSAEQIVLGRTAAETLEVGVGDRIDLAPGFAPTDDAGAAPEITLEVVGIAADPAGALLGTTPRLMVQQVNAAAVLGPTEGTLTQTWLATVPDGSDPAEAAARAADSAAPGVTVRSVDAAEEEAAEDLLRGFAVLGLLLAVFVIIALFTSAVVIANTFAVTLAQRTRSLALLRTLGATRRQVRGVVLRESLLVGLLGAGLGMLAGHVLVQAALVGAAALGLLEVLVPVPVTLWSVLLPLLAGIAITVLASLAPMRQATRVAPLQALRPAPPAAARHLGVREAAGLAAVVLGMAALAGGTALAVRGVAAPGLLAAIVGGVVSFTGVMLGLVTLTRPLAALAARTAGLLGGLPARIAGANVARNPRRSAATIAALLIGTTLMTMMTVGARTAEATLTAELDSRRPIDLVLSADEMPEDAAARIAAIPGIDAADTTARGDVEVGADEPMTLVAATPETVRELSHRPAMAADLTDGTVLLGLERAERFGLHDGQVLTLRDPDGRSHELRVQVDANLQMSLVTPGTLEQLVGDGTRPVVLADFADPGSAGREGVDIRELVAAVDEVSSGEGFTGASSMVGGAEREAYGQILDVLLGITVALLAVAVLVALVGVANTLSLGVVERTGENALLRALGTTRRQMRAMLGWEGVLLAAVGAVLGLLIGSLYGVLGIIAILGSTYPVSITIPWDRLVIVLLLALAAGALASVLPGRAAARTAPAAALAAGD